MKSALNTDLMVTGAAYRVCESTSAKSVSRFGRRDDETPDAAPLRCQCKHRTCSNPDPLFPREHVAGWQGFIYDLGLVRGGGGNGARVQRQSKGLLSFRAIGV